MDTIAFISAASSFVGAVGGGFGLYKVISWRVTAVEDELRITRQRVHKIELNAAKQGWPV